MKSLKLFVAFLATMISGSMAAQTITANDVVIEKGKTADVTFTINAQSKAAIAEFRLYLPQGIAVQFDEDEDDYVYELGSTMTVKTHAATIKKQPDGSFYVLVSNSAGKEFKAASGDYLTLTLEAGDNAASGVATVKDIILGTVDAQQMNTITESSFNVTVAGEVVVPDTYTVAGTADLTGYFWDPAQNTMTLNAAGLYEWTAYNVTVSNEVQPEFKIVKNGSWDSGSWPENNWVITPNLLGGEGIYTITITFNPETASIAVTGVKTGEIEPVNPPVQTSATITANDVTIERGGTANVTFTINADSKAAIAEFRLYLPEGVNIMYDEDEEEYVCELGGSMTVKTHSATIKKQYDGSYYVLVSNSAGKEFKAESGDYLTLTLVADANAASGVATMKDIILGDLTAHQMNTVTESSFNVTVTGEIVVPDTYTVAGTTDLTGYAWDATQNTMTLNAATGLYEWKAYNVTVSNEVQPEFKVVKNGSWDSGSWPENNWVITPNLLGGEGIYTITITFNPATAAIAVTGVKTGEIEPVNPPVQSVTITANDVTIERGGTANVTFTINSDTKAAIAEFKLNLPQGVYILYNDDEDDYVYELNSSMTLKTHSATIKKQQDGTYYVLVSNSAGKEFKAASGDYLTLTLVAGANAASGEAIMRDIIIGDLTAQQMNTVTASTFNVTVTGEVVPPAQTAIITANDVTIERGQMAEVTFTINSDSKAAIAEFRLDLPEGVYILYNDDEEDYVYELNSSMTLKTHSATIKKQQDGSYYVLVSNSAGKEFKAASGDYLTLTLVATKDAVSGVAIMSDIILGDLTAHQMNTVTVSSFNVTVSGATGGDDEEEALWQRCDVNGDGKVDVADLQTIMRMMAKKL